MKYFAVAALLNVAYGTEKCYSVEDCPFDANGAPQYCGKRQGCTDTEKKDEKMLCRSAADYATAAGTDKVAIASGKLEGCVWNYGWMGYGAVRDNDCKAAKDCLNADDDGMFCAKIASCKIASNNSDGKCFVNAFKAQFEGYSAEYKT